MNPPRLAPRRYTESMGYFQALAVAAFFLADAPSVPSGWKVLKDSKGACQIAIPADWDEQAGFAVLKDSTTAIAVVTSQPGQTLKPLSETALKTLRVPKDKIFENSARRVYYQDKIAANPSDTNAFSIMVPGKAGTCSARVVFLPEVTGETARKIVLSAGPALE